MINKIIVDSLELFKSIILNPAEIFQKIKKGEHDLSIYFLFLASCLIPLFKSFSIKSYRNNFFPNQNFNEILSFFNIPQIQCIVTFLSFILFIFLMGMFCKLFLKRDNKKDLTVCFLSIGSAGILLQLLFFIIDFF